MQKIVILVSLLFATSISQAQLNKPLASILDSIYSDDQVYREQVDSLMKKYGWESKEMKALWKTIDEKDSINIIKVKAILDTEGWLGAEDIGKKGNSTL